MNAKLLRTLLLLGTILLLFSFSIPKGWIKGETHLGDYDMGTDTGAGQNGINAATIKSVRNDINGFGALRQQCLPKKFTGKRIRMSGYMKSKDVKNWAALWLRVDDYLSFDNMHDGVKDRSIKGTTDWTKCEIVLDVPICATRIVFGAMLAGTGQIWFDNLKFEIVDNSVSTTGMSINTNYVDLTEPLNLDFSQ